MTLHSLLHCQHVYLISIIFSIMKPKKGLYNNVNESHSTRSTEISLSELTVRYQFRDQMILLVFTFVSLFYVPNFIFRC